jgi:hypothetical protein
MYEITHKGAWFKWSTLDRTDKRLLTLSLVAAIPPGFLLGLISGIWGFRAGYRMGSGGREVPPQLFDDLLARLAPAPVVLGALVCVLVSAFAWWRFSRRQDEMFNRIQNHALGCGCGWAVAGATIWWFLEKARLVPALPTEAWLAAALFLVCGFWFHAVRRWA